WLDWTKGDRVFEVIDARTLQVLRKVNMGQKLAEFGLKGASSAVRPMALSPDERFAYLQVSFLHGFVEYDLELDKVTRVAQLPLSEEASKLRRDQYVLDSAHHGIAMSGDGTKLCVAGTMSNYAAIVSRDSFRHRTLPLGARTYWATTSADGKYCYVSVAGDDTVSVISYATEAEVARIPVGDHPQRARTAKLAESVLR
ncbi:MAG TPA: YncE family protein, partial [Catenuloplanes sp.]